MDSFTKKNIINSPKGSYPDIVYRIKYLPSERLDFIEFELWKQWVGKYPIFDSSDVELVKEQPGHYYEWSAAIHIYMETGYLSLIEKYQFAKTYPVKWARFKSIVPKQLVELIESKQYGRTQCPDLFVYDENRNDWFFCEVKGPSDRLHERQTEFFHAIEALCHKPIRLIRFKE